MLKFNLSSFEDYIEYDLVLPKEQISFDKGILLDAGLKVHVAFTKESSHSIIVTGHVQGSLTVTCSRCLKEYTSPIEDDFVYIYKSTELITDEDKDNDVIEFKNNEIDIYDQLRQTLLLDVPMKPLCTEDCKGLCPVCGKNLNDEKCDCNKDFRLNPFEGLDIK
jgi:uncharacterized protein